MAPANCFVVLIATGIIVIGLILVSHAVNLGRSNRPRPCRHCGYHEVRVRARFCGHCGKPRHAQDSKPVPPADETERDTQ